MTSTISFTKASGAGNDFVLVNNMSGALSLDYSRLAKAVCDRHFGVGGDGLLVLERSSEADFRMLYYNADGSSGGMCGNGGRCAARFAHLEGIAGTRQSFEALDHIYHAEVAGGSVRLRMKDPAGFRSRITLIAGGRSLGASFIDTGAPHVVAEVSDLEALDVPLLGREIRNAREFAPGGTNVNFVSPGIGSTVRLRTYERGVEAETLACGTGSVAAALVSSYLHGQGSPVTVSVRSGEQLRVHFRGEPGGWTEIVLEGSAHILFTGSMIYDDTESIIRVAP